MKEILLTKNQVARVDDSDYEWLSQYRWHTKTYGGKFYAARHEAKTHRTILMHREILGVTDPKRDVDHANLDPLDNRRENIRECSRRENLLNRKMPSNNTTGFKGVYRFVSRKGNWEKVYFIAQFCRKIVGRFSSPLRAAIAYNDAASKQYGKFALLNDLSGVFDGT